MRTSQQLVLLISENFHPHNIGVKSYLKNIFTEMSKNVMFIGSYEFEKGFSEKSDLFGRLLDICLPIIYSERKPGPHFTDLLQISQSF